MPPMKADAAVGAGRLSDLGTVFQIAYVPRDFDAALKFWTEVMGVGPFYRRSRLRFPECRYRGQPSDIEFSVSIAYWGDTQVELIEQHNDAPSIYTAWHDAGHDGVQHVCIAVPDIAAAKAECEARGLAIEQEVGWPGGGAIYVDAGGGPGTMVEMIQLNPAMEERFAMIRAAGRVWDGRDPLRES